MNQSLQQIPAGEQRWMSESFADPNGRLFEWRGEIYRVLEAQYAARWRDLVADGTIGKMDKSVFKAEGIELATLPMAGGAARSIVYQSSVAPWRYARFYEVTIVLR